MRDHSIRLIAMIRKQVHSGTDGSRKTFISTRRGNVNTQFKTMTAIFRNNVTVLWASENASGSGNQYLLHVDSDYT